MYCCGVWTLPLGVIWRWSCSVELLAFLLTFSSRVLRCGLDGAVRSFGQRLGWRRCTASQLVYSSQVFQPLVFIVYYYIFYHFIVKRLRPLFVGGAIQIPFDWLIDKVMFCICIPYCIFKIYSAVRLSSCKCVINSVFLYISARFHGTEWWWQIWFCWTCHLTSCSSVTPSGERLEKHSSRSHLCYGSRCVTSLTYLCFVTYTIGAFIKT